MEKHNSCINSLAIIQHLDEKCPERTDELFLDLGPEMDGIADPRAFLSDPNNWISSQLLLRLYDNAKRILKDENAAYKIGFRSVLRKRLGYIQSILFLALGSPARIIKHIHKVNAHFNRTKNVKLIQCSSTGATVRLSWVKGIPLSRDFCLMNQGVYQAVPLTFGLPPGLVRETKCFFKGDPYCEYDLQWQKKNLLKYLWDRFVAPWKIHTGTLAELERDKKALKKKYKQVHQLNLTLQAKINQLSSLQKTSTAILSTLNRDEIFDLVLKSLQKVAHLNRAGIFLADRNKESLTLIHAVGLNEEELQTLKGYQIPLNKQNNIIARTAHHDGPVFVDDVASMMLNPDNPLLKTLHPKAFILVPLRARDQVIGVLVGDRENDRRFIQEIDKEFLASFANNIAMAIENTNLYRRLGTSERKYRQMVEHAHEGIWMLDVNGAVSFSNRRINTLLGFGDLTGKNVYELVEEGSKGKFLKIFHYNMEGRTAREELDLVDAQGQGVRVLLSSVPMHGDNGFNGSLAMITDLTELRRMEEGLVQVQKLESVGTLAGGIAHDFNNILTSILAHATVLKRTIGNKCNVTDQFETIENSCRQATDLVKQLLAFSRGTSDKEVKLCRLNDIIPDTLKLFQSSLPRNITVSTDLQTDIPPIEGNPSQILQVILNILINAKDAMPAGGELHISLHRARHTGNCPVFQAKDIGAGDYARLLITDTGHGIAPEIADKIFDPFFTTKEPGKGSGLGLSMVFGIMRKLGGCVHLASKEGSGTTFELHFPLKSDAELEAAGLRKSDAPLSLHRILLLGREPFFRDLYANILSRAGYQVVTVLDAEEALTLLAGAATTAPPSLVLLESPAAARTATEIMEKFLEYAPEVGFLFYGGKEPESSTTPFPAAKTAWIAKASKESQLLQAVDALLVG